MLHMQKQRGSMSQGILSPSGLVRPAFVKPMRPPADAVFERATKMSRGHDIVVLGASAGGVETLRRLMELLTPDLAAAFFVVMHTSPHAPSALPELLSRAGSLPARHAVDGEKIEHGRVYVAPPDFHLLLEPNRVRLEHGPKENRHRPSIDVLFRTAASHYRSRVIGVVLSGTLDD